MKLAIIEDEPKTRSFLKALLTDQLENITVVGEADSVATGVEMIREAKPEVILLDVEMGDGNGFDLLAKLHENRPHVIFVTAYDHYAIQALRADAVDYIEKPVNPQELTAALEKVQKMIDANEEPPYEQLLESVKHEIREKIAVPTRTGLMYLSANEIISIKADGAYSQIVAEGQSRPLIISRTLKDIQPALEKLGFIRLHRSHLVNASKIKELNKTDGGFVVLSNNTQVPFSKQYKEKAIQLIREMTTFL